jgi:hypothetical protein
MILRHVLIIVFGFQVALNLTRPIMTLYASEMGSSTFEIGILTADFLYFSHYFLSFKPVRLLIKSGTDCLF